MRIERISSVTRTVISLLILVMRNLSHNLNNSTVEIEALATDRIPFYRLTCWPRSLGQPRKWNITSAQCCSSPLITNLMVSSKGHPPKQKFTLMFINQQMHLVIIAGYYKLENYCQTLSRYQYKQTSRRIFKIPATTRKEIGRNKRNTTTSEWTLLRQIMLGCEAEFPP